jgi:hypothetical protein
MDPAAYQVQAAPSEAALRAGNAAAWDSGRVESRTLARAFAAARAPQSGERDKPAGIPHMIAPGKRTIGMATPDWGSALVLLPWSVACATDDAADLARFYDAMRRWTDFLLSERSDDGLLRKGLGDWSSPSFCWAGVERWAGTREVPVTSTAMLVRCLDVMAWPLAPDAARASLLWESLRRAVDGGRRFDAGIFGTPAVLEVLNRNGEGDAAIRLLTKPELPSYRALLDLGATDAEAARVLESGRPLSSAPGVHARGFTGTGPARRFVVEIASGAYEFRIPLLRDAARK